MTCIVAYDIESNKTRNRLARYLEKIGRRVQKSVFAVEIERHAFKRFLAQMMRITGGGGKIAVIRLCAGCRKNAMHVKEEGGKFFYVF